MGRRGASKRRGRGSTGRSATGSRSTNNLVNEGRLLGPIRSRFLGHGRRNCVARAIAPRWAACHARFYSCVCTSPPPPPACARASLETRLSSRCKVVPSPRNVTLLPPPPSFSILSFVNRSTDILKV